MLIKRLSATKLETFVVCPYSYFLKYVKRKVKKGFRTQGMTFGLLIHKILEEFHKAMATISLPTEDAVLRQIIYLKAKEKTIELVNIYNARYKNSRQNAAFVFNFCINPFVVYYVNNKLYLRSPEPEKTFSKTLQEIANTLDVNKLTPGWEKFKDIVAVGKMDLYVAPDLIFDYKVQDPKNFQKDLIDNFQTLLYTLIFESDMTFIYLFINKTIIPKAVMISKEGRADKFNRIIEILKLLDDATSFKKNPKSCAECILKSICKKA